MSNPFISPLLFAPGAPNSDLKPTAYRKRSWPVQGATWFAIEAEVSGRWHAVGMAIGGVAGYTSEQECDLDIADLAADCPCGALVPQINQADVEAGNVH